MQTFVVETALLDQQAELDTLRGQKLIHRPEEDKINLHSKLAQVIIGVRRSGKSTLCFNALEKSGLKYAYVNFDDERLGNLKPEDLNTVLELLYKIYGKFEHLFLDEIQNVDAWPLFVNRLLRQGVRLVITGSNAKLLSSELATHLTGRHHTIELYPFSFKEWCRVKDVDFSRMTTQNRGLLQNALTQYMHVGGFPEMVFEGDDKSYINSLVKSILTRDIAQRFKLRNTEELTKLANHVLNELPDTFTVKGLMEACGIRSTQTINRYLSYLKQTYLICPLCTYTTKSRLRLSNEKYYAIDVSLMDRLENAFARENLGWRLETIVYLELLRRYPRERYDIYYRKDRSSETDFIVCDGSKTLAVYQVCYDISAEKTLKREVRGCLVGAKTTHCENLYLITDHESRDLESEGYKIKVRPAYEWLVEEPL